MAARTIKVLHIEDNLVQQRVTAHHLSTLTEYAFAITTADSEDLAVAEFTRLRPELVILDYHLAEGNGLDCLRKLRRQDAIVPILALSGKATPEIAAELLKVGADDYLSKHNLTSEVLARSVREVLTRSDAWKRLSPAGGAGEPVPGPVAERFDELWRWFAAHNGSELLQRLDAFESAAQQVRLSESQLHNLFEASGAAVQRELRPLLLEILLRLFGEAGSKDEDRH
jgi:DNA-binding response OmpR family regulator